MTEMTPSAHVGDEIPGLLDGSTERGEALAAIAHLRDCDDCRQELVTALLAHASLASAARTAPTLRSDAPVTSAGAPLPDLAALLAQFDQDGEEVARRRRLSASPRRTSRWLAVAAAVIGLGAGGGVVAAIDHHDSSSSSSTTVALAAYGAGRGSGTVTGTATMSGDDMTVNAAALSTPATGSLYEVWLTNAARTQMHALGWIDTDGRGSFTVPAELRQQYTAIEVSLQKLDAAYTYSGTSVLRGSY